MPAILEGVAVAAGKLAIEAATSTPTTILIPTRRLTRTLTGPR
jgi:hypothetical protein